MKQYNNGPRKGMMYGGATRRKPMMYGGTATKPRKKAQMGGMMQSAPMMQPQKMKPTQMQPAGMSMNMAEGGKASLKPVPEDNKGLGKLPKPVRNKMGYMMYGGKAKKRG